MAEPRRNWLVLVLRLLFVALLLASATGKLANMPGFYAVVATYRALPGALIPAAAWLLALAEGSLALWLLSGRALRWAGSAVVALHLLYLGWLLAALGRGLDIANCGCFGVYFALPLTRYSLVEDFVLLLLALLLWRGVQDDVRTTRCRRRRGWQAAVRRGG